MRVFGQLFIAVLISLVLGFTGSIVFADSCFEDGTLTIKASSPMEGTLLEASTEYIFTFTVDYEFTTTYAEGSLSMLAYDMQTFENLDNQIQDDVPVNSQSGRETLSITATTSVDGKDVKNLEVSVGLFTGSSNCTEVFDEIVYSTDVATLISAKPISHNFGETQVSKESVQVSFIIKNVAFANLDISEILIAGDNAEDFAIMDDTCSNQTVEPKETCYIEVVFSPKTEGEKSTLLSIESNDSNTPLDIPLSGTGIPFVSAPDNFSYSIGECTTSIFGTTCAATLSWTNVSAASGYKLYYGFSSGSYLASIDLGNVTSKTFGGLPKGTYYLAISAYDSRGNESDKSEELALIVGESSVPTNLSATVSDCTEDIFGITTCTVSLSWTGVNGSSGYYLHYGFSSSDYDGTVDVENVTSLTYAGIAEGTYYLALTSYDSEREESGYSDELILEVGSGSNSVNRVERSPSPFAR